MTLDSRGILDAVVSHALAAGVFERVNLHEPKSAPGNGLTADVWIDRLEATPLASGLAVTAAVLTVNLRVYGSAMALPADSIDPNMLTAVDVLMTAYVGDFTLGGLIRNVDVLGEHGELLAAQAGYVELDHKMFRVMTIRLPLVVNDAWPQVE